jgi:PIN domain nuclease of toxin-antitoxin system
VATLTQLDTHVLMWLYRPQLDLLSPAAAQAIEEGDLVASPMAALELSYLHEVGRIGTDAPTVLASLERQIGLRLDDSPFGRVVAIAHDLTWTRDPFDRLIAAQALASGAQLVTSDKTIRANLPVAVW